MFPWILGLSLLGSCALKEGIEGLTNRLVVEATMIGIAEPNSTDIDLSGTDYAKACLLTVFVADATTSSELSEAAIDDAHVAVLAPGVGRIILHNRGGGLYTATGLDGLEYFETEEYTVQVNVDGEESAVVSSAPFAPEVRVAADHDQGASLNVDLSDQQFDAVLVAVVDVLAAEVTYSNEPETIAEIYRFTHEEENVKRHEIPGRAFGAQSIYGVGIAGMRYAGDSDYENMNTILSSFLIGQMRFLPLYTF